MPTYTAILISVNNVGGTDVTIQENNGVGTVNQLLATVGNEPLLLDSVDIYSTNKSQMEQPIEFIRKELNGNERNFIQNPTLSVYQLNNTIKGIQTKDVTIDENTYINYTIQPNTNVKLTLNINKAARKYLSYTKILDIANQNNMFDVVIKEIGFREPDEIPAWDGRPTDNFRENAEILRFFPVTGEQPIIYKPVNKNSNGIGLALLLVGVSFITFIAGKGQNVYKFKN
jgi:hypothetical protein